MGNYIIRSPEVEQYNILKENNARLQGKLDNYLQKAKGKLEAMIKK
jgi:hypothetical protein